MTLCFITPPEGPSWTASNNGPSPLGVLGVLGVRRNGTSAAGCCSRNGSSHQAGVGMGASHHPAGQVSLAHSTVMGITISWGDTPP